MNKALITALSILYLAGCGAEPSPQTTMAVEAEDTNESLADKSLATLMADYWEYDLAAHPLSASSVGDYRYQSELGHFTFEALQKDLDYMQDTLTKLHQINRDDLSQSAKTNYDIFGWMLENEMKRQALPSSKYFTFNSYSGWHVNFAQTIVQTPIRNSKDIEDYISRLNQFPRYTDEAITVMREAIAQGWVQPCDSLKGYGDTIKAMIAKEAEDSFAYKPVRNLNTRLSDRQTEIQAQIRGAIEDSINPSIQKFYDFYQEEYQPACRHSFGISAIENGGAQAYEALVAFYATTPTLTADQVHNIGLSEVARIRAEMQKILDEVAFDGDLEDFLAYMRTNPEFYPKSDEEYMAYTAEIAKRIDRELPKYFAILPRNRFTITPIPAAQAPKTTMAYYSPGSLKAGIAGQYFLNFYKLDTRNLNELPALGLHEASPGHHMQISLQQEMEEMPDFRKHYYLSAFGEGWGLYSEYLGEEMGIYRTPYERFGRLTFEMWRACRLVVDTGIHAKGWSRQQAIDYMMNNTSLSLQNITAEVDRYITWPGQAISYKLGELKIKELRARAESTLGDDFDIRRFHSHLLAGGSMPLAALEKRMDEWIAAEQAQ